MKTEGQRFEDAYDDILKVFRDRTGKKKLSASLEARLLRWKVARTYFLTFKPLTDFEVVQHLVSEFNYSEAQAYHDIRDCKRFFAEMEAVNKEFELIMLKADIRSLRAQCLAAGKLSVAAKCDATLAALGQFDQPTPGAGNGAKEIHLNMTFNPKLVGAKEIPNLLQTVERFIGEAAKRELMIEDADFEEIHETTK